MANLERIRSAIRRSRRFFREEPQEVDAEIEDLVLVIVGIWKLGYGVAIVDSDSAESIRSGRGPDVDVWDPDLRMSPSASSESDWREAALTFLEESAREMGEIDDLLFVDRAGESGSSRDSILASDLLDYVKRGGNLREGLEHDYRL